VLELPAAGGSPDAGDPATAPEPMIEIPLLPAAERAQAHPREAAGQFAVPPSVMRIDAENERIRITLFPQSLDVQIVDGAPTINSFDGTYYLTLKFADPQPEAAIP